MRNHPAEVALSVAAFAVACFDYEDREGRSWDVMLSYYPVVSPRKTCPGKRRA